MKKLLIAGAIAIALPLQTAAHHGHNTSFDTNKLIDVTGVITKLRFVNPHSYVYFDVTTASGEVENWYCEMRAANVMKRSGWSADMFAKGEPIRVQGIASRKSATGCYVETLTLGDDVTLTRYAQIEENKGKPQSIREETTSWGDPNIAGDWAAPQRLVGAVSGPNANRHGPGGPGRGRPPAIKLTEAGEAALAEMEKTRKAAGDSIAGRLDCLPRDLFRDWTFDQHTNLIVQEKDKITMKYGFMDTVRIIHLDQKTHPADITPSFTGHSIGHWEEGVLVVDTIGFAPKLMTRGPFVVGAVSDQLHVVERISVDQKKGELTISFEANDPEFWQKGQVQSDKSTVYLSELPWEPYNCVELSDEVA